uniref:Uncharacterized protein n=1 Tax=Cannabis sativa TaxID=3483 RepID=A0A803PDW3_CANSA
MWRQQVQAAIRDHNLHYFVSDSASPPLMYVDEAAHDQGKVNQEFLDWEQLDQLWVVKLLDRFGEHFNEYFASQIQLLSTKKLFMSIYEFLHKIKSVVDQLDSVGHCVSVNDHITAILNGLSLLARPVAEMMTLEQRIEKDQREVDSAYGSENLAQ